MIEKTIVKLLDIFSDFVFYMIIVFLQPFGSRGAVGAFVRQIRGQGGIKMGMFPLQICKKFL